MDDILLEKYQNSDGDSDQDEGDDDRETGEAGEEEDDDLQEVEDAPKIVFSSKKSADSSDPGEGL